MKYSDDYMYAKDIDWFCVINDNYIHAASAGGILPEPINDREKLRKLQKQVYDLSPIFLDEDIIINNSFINERFYNNNEKKSDYLQSFMSMAKKGFVSMDRTNLFDLDDQRYHIVCMPKYKKPIEGLNEIFKIRIEGISFQKPENGIKLFDYCK